MAFKALESFDWRSLRKYLTSNSARDLNAFLERLPQNASKSVLIAAGVLWGSASLLGLFTVVKIQELTTLSHKRGEANALLPIVPVLKDKPVEAVEVSAFVDKIKNTYKDLDIKANAENIVVTAKSTLQFSSFRESIGHIQNGGSGWRVNLERLCVGQECQQYPLAAAVKINKISVDAVDNGGG